MSRSLRQKQGILRNKLLRYKKIVELYQLHKTEDIPVTVIYRKYIEPTFHISRVTLYNALNTPINKQLKELKELEDQQLSLF